MSLIKAIDVPKYMADRMRSRRLAARLSNGSVKPKAAAKDTAAPIAIGPPASER